MSAVDKLKLYAETFFHKHSSTLILNGIKVLAFIIITGLMYGTYKFLSLFLPATISILIVIYLLYRLALTLCRVITFPGSTWYWKRNIENYFQKAYVNKMKRRITSLRALVEYILEERLWHNFFADDELLHIKKTIASTLLIFQKQVARQTLNPKQKEAMGQFEEIEQMLNQLKIVNRADGQSVTFWDFLDGRDRRYDNPKTILYFEDKNRGYYLLNKCTQLEDRLVDIVSKKKWHQSLKRWMFEETFGTLNQLREEFDMRYKCKSISIKTDSDVVLDCMLVYGRNSKEERHSMFEKRSTRGSSQEPKRDQPSDRTIIFCCPNAGYYEYMFCENEWVEMYLRNGFNIFLWNYRGFGRSTGSPTPNGLRRDGEAIVDFLRKEMKMKKIGVHGESLGGIVTTHIARAKNIDYMCADRTFASLSRVAEVSFGSVLAKIFRILTLWDDQISRDYLLAPCYKIITCDPKDEIINLLSSLKYGVTARIVQQKLGYKDVIPHPNLLEDNQAASLRLFNFFKKTGRVLKLELNIQKIQKEVNEYNELLSKGQTRALFCAFNRISELFTTLSSLNALNTRKKGGRSKDSRPKMSKPMQPGRGSESSDTNSRSTANQDDEDPRQRSIIKNQSSTDEGISFVNETKGLNESLDPKGTTQSDDSDITESILKKSYSQEFDEEAQSSEKVVELLVKIFGVFEELEAGGVFISDIMSLKENHRFLAFQHFIQSFKIWGSYYPLSKIIEDAVLDNSYFHNHAINKVKDFINKTEKILQKQKQQHSRKNNKLIAHVLDDLEIISSLMPNLYQRLIAKNTNPLYTGATNTSRYNKSKQQNEIELELGPNKDNQAMLRSNSGAYSDLETHSADDYNNIGRLIPLTCGHNGTPRPHEVQIFEFLLRCSGIAD